MKKPFVSYTLYSFGHGCTIVYENGVFATVANDMQAKLEEAKLKYPIGTEFNCVVTNFKCKVVKGIAISDNYPNDLKAMADSGNQVGVIYDGATDTWATIIQEPIIINGKEVEFKRSGWVDINDMWFSKSELTALQSLNPIFTEILKRMEEKNNGSGNQ